MNAPKIVTYQGVEMPVPEAAAKAGLSRHTVNSRLLRGWSTEDAFKAVEPKYNRPDRPARRRRQSNTLFVRYEGKLMPLTAACELAGLNAGTVYSRLRRGVKEANAFKAPWGKSKRPAV